jgi:hypothetical protein
MSNHRTIVVDGQEYRWRHSSNRDGDELVCAWIDGHRRAIVLIRFNHLASGHPDFLEGFGYIRQVGIVECGVRAYNLNRPAVAADLIRLAQTLGWAPLGDRLLTLDGFALLREHATQLTHELLYDPWLELATQLLERRAAADGQPPLAWLRARTPHAWDSLVRQPGPPVPFALASVLQFGVWLEQPGALTPAQLAELTVWADAQQHRAQPGGLALATWLARGSISGTAELDDLRHWCRALREQASRA